MKKIVLILAALVLGLVSAQAESGCKRFSTSQSFGITCDYYPAASTSAKTSPATAANTQSFGGTVNVAPVKMVQPSEEDVAKAKQERDKEVAQAIAWAKAATSYLCPHEKELSIWWETNYDMGISGDGMPMTRIHPRALGCGDQERIYQKYLASSQK